MIEKARPRDSAGAGLLLTACLAAAVPSTAWTAPDVRFTVDARESVKPISPYIYGTNQPDWNGTTRHLTFARVGGNRWTAYNWETNASNAGKEWHHQNDDFLGRGDKPGEAVRLPVAAAHAAGASVLVTVPIGGYVAADKDGGGDVSLTPNYFANRFFKSLPRKGTAFAFPPNRDDRVVYQDEFVHWLDQTFPKARTDPARTIFYSLDNEPDLWSNTHARIHPDKLTYAEIVQRDREYASAIKAVVPEALVFGPVSYGWNGFTTLQNAPDAKKRDFLDFYLADMRAADKESGKRLLDVLDIHWYPEIYVGGVRLTGNDARPAMVSARLQAPRSLWDPAFTEDSWIARWFTKGPIRLLPRLHDKIARDYPGTRLAISEYHYGGGKDISGAIAEADVLGIFGREGVFAAAIFHGDRPDDQPFIYGGVAMYRNFDGADGSFGDTSVAATTTDVERTAIYAGVDAGKSDRLVLVAINKSAAPLAADFAVAHAATFTRAAVYQLTAASPTPRRVEDVAITGSNSFRSTLPAMSVSTLVLRP